MSDVANILLNELREAEREASVAAKNAAHWQDRHVHEAEKAVRIRALLTYYEDGSATVEGGGQTHEPSSEAAAEKPATPAQPDHNVSPTATPEKTISKRARVRQEITVLLREYGSRHRKQLLDHLTAIGVMGNEKDPMASLAAYLSEDKRIFLTDGRGNFSLRPNAG